jgi:hypothetical protein
MHAELADEIVLIAAPIYAALLTQVVSIDGLHAPAEMLADLRQQAIAQALALRLDVLSTVV